MTQKKSISKQKRGQILSREKNSKKELIKDDKSNIYKNHKKSERGGCGSGCNFL